MVIHELSGPAPSELQRRIEEFEAAFLSPFGGDRHFRIDYGGDRTAFVRSIGEAALCLAAEKDGRILGFMEMARVRLRTPDGADRLALYIADLKLLPEARSKLAAARLMQKAAAWGRTFTDLGFSVAMDETPLKPSDYTGRAGVERLQPVARIAVARLATEPGAGPRASDDVFIASREQGVACYHRLSAGRYATEVRPPFERSETQPAWFVHPSGLACGRFEDRRKVRRLIADDGSELRPAYLACFAFADADAAVDLLSVAVRHAELTGFRAVRVCMAADDLVKLQRRTGPAAILGIGGTIFATAACAPGALWNINASEI